MTIKKVISLVLICSLVSGCGHTSKKQSVEPPKKAPWEMFELGDSVTILIPADNLFEPATDIFTDKGKAVLAQVTAVLKKYPKKNILVTGNTSEINTSQFEQTLSNKQAAKVVNYFSAHGIQSDSRKLYYAGLGSTQPIANQHLAEGIATNRRIQITLYEDKPEQRSKVVDPINSM